MGKRFRTSLFCLLALTVLAIDSKTALYGASEGVLLCIRTVIPALYPYMIITTILSAELMGTGLRQLRPLCKLCRIPEGSASLLLTGFLGGYPTGAQNVALSYERGSLSRKDAQRMLGFCSNAGPAFLFGFLSQKFNHGSTVFFLWLVHILSALLTGMLMPGSGVKESVDQQKKTLGFTQALNRCTKAMASICSWVLLFRIVAAFLDRWILWLFPVQIQVAVLCILDLANGCSRLSQVIDPGLRFIIASGALGFGGICVILQTDAVIGTLKGRNYVAAKLLQGILSVILAYFCQLIVFSHNECWFGQPFLAVFLFVILIGILFVMYKLKIIVAFCKKIVYNFKKRRNEALPCCSAEK